MADGYVTKECVIGGSIGGGVACAASATTVVSNVIPISQENSLRFSARVSLSAATVATAITVQVEDSPAEDVWELVGSEASATVSAKTFTQGVREATAITWPATAAATQGDYVHVVTQDGTKIAVWLDIDANGTAPTGVLYAASDVQIKVSIVGGGSAAANAALARAAVVANATWAAKLTTSVVTTATFTATQVLGGAVTDAAPLSANDGGAGSITISVTTAGTNGASATNLTTDVITSATHGFITGQRVIYNMGTLQSEPLVNGTRYYVIKVDANTLKLATTQALAYAGTQIDLTTYGVGTGGLVAADYELRMIIEDATDNAQLPLWPKARVTCTTGSGDTCTVSSVTWGRRF